MQDKYGIYKLIYADDHEIKLILYGPDENGKLNYNLLVDGNNYFTLSHTRNNTQKRLSAKDRDYPDPIKKNASGYQINKKQYMPGHCIDHVDSIIPSNDILKRHGKICCSSFNSENYIPEIQKDYWGLYMRKGLVTEQRKNHQGYAQLVEYPEQPHFTAAKVALPESLYFFRLDGHYQPQQVCWIEWSQNYNQHKKPSKTNMVEHMEQFSTSLEASPRALVWDIRNTDRSWGKFVSDKRLLGHQIRKNEGIDSFNPERDQLYAYGDASSLEYANSYASISMALAASLQKKIKLTSATLNKAIQQGEKLMELDAKSKIINRNRLFWVQKYHNEQQPGFEDKAIVDAVRQLTF
ncbi:MAG TPA: hypothetical protein VJL60_00745 [Gammaproteobacteria bacterium]|nr:hypothetical protein [Gammaproteobacteria bacterium]